MMMRILTAALICVAGLAGPTLAQQETLESRDLGGGIHVIFGPGGNIGLSVGADGAFLIDDKFDRLSERLIATVAAITDRPIRFLINTHWHGDHTGGNRALGEAGTVIVAHRNVRNRLSREQFQEIFNRTTPPSPREALPVITFSDSISFHLNGDEARVYHTPRAHTDGDSIIYFEKANVIHMGDLYFSGMYPFVDIDSGGTLAGLVGGLDLALSLIDAETQVISGHGNVTGAGAFREYRNVAATVNQRLEAMVAGGKSLEEILEAEITADFDEEWGGGYDGLNDPESFIKLAYRGLTGQRE